MNNSFNSISLSSGSPLAGISGDRFRIDGYNIHNTAGLTGGQVYVIEKRDGFLTNLKAFDYPSNNGRGFISNYFRGRGIILDVLVKGDNEIEFNNKLDEVRKFVAQNEVYLEEKINDVYRKIKVNIISCPLDKKHYNITFMQFSIQLQALEPFWYETDYTTVSYLNTTANLQEELTNEGTAEIFPTINLAFTSATSVTSVALDIGGTSITISETIAASDVLIIDCDAKTVKLNAVEVEYSGVLPKLEVGTNIINFTINGTFDVDINVLFRKHYK